MFTKKEILLLSPFYIQSLILSLSKVILAFYTLYFLQTGFTLLDVALLGSIRSIVVIIFEVPTGALADKYGKK